MGTERASATSMTLLERLARSPADQVAWADFVDRYGPRVYAWCRGWGAQDADARDVTQEVLLRLSARLRTFQYDPTRSFRGWLLTVTHHAWLDCKDRLCRAGRGTGAGGSDVALASIAARDDLVQRLREEFDHELLECAMGRVRLRVAARTWDCFRLTALEGMSGAEAANLLSMKPSQVYLAKSDVRRFIFEEVQQLESDG